MANTTATPIVYSTGACECINCKNHRSKSINCQCLNCIAHRDDKYKSSSVDNTVVVETKNSYTAFWIIFIIIVFILIMVLIMVCCGGKYTNNYYTKETITETTSSNGSKTYYIYKDNNGGGTGVGWFVFWIFISFLIIFSPTYYYVK